MKQLVQNGNKKIFEKVHTLQYIISAHQKEQTYQVTSKTAIYNSNINPTVAMCHLKNPKKNTRKLTPRQPNVFHLTSAFLPGIR